MLYARNIVARAAGAIYPLAVTLTIVVTGNHFIFDAVAGGLVMAVGFAATAPFRVGASEPAYARSP
jgi:hypothetical protein